MPRWLKCKCKGGTKTKKIRLTGYVTVNSTDINVLGALKMIELFQKLYSPRLIIVFQLRITLPATKQETFSLVRSYRGAIVTSEVGID